MVRHSYSSSSSSNPLAAKVYANTPDFVKVFDGDGQKVSNAKTGTSLGTRLSRIFSCQTSGCWGFLSGLLSCIPYAMLLAAGVGQSWVAVRRIPVEAWLASLILSAVQLVCLLLIAVINLRKAINHPKERADQSYSNGKVSSNVLGPLMNLTMKLSTTTVNDCAAAVQGLSQEDSTALNRLLSRIDANLPTSTPNSRTPPKEEEAAKPAPEQKLRRMVSFKDQQDNLSSSSDESEITPPAWGHTDSQQSRASVERGVSGVLKKSAIKPSSTILKKQGSHESMEPEIDLVDLERQESLDTQQNKRSSLRHSDTDISVSSFTSFCRNNRSFTLTSEMDQNALAALEVSPEAELALERDRQLSLENREINAGIASGPHRGSLLALESGADDSRKLQRMGTTMTAFTTASERREMMRNMAGTTAQEIGNFAWNMDGTCAEMENQVQLDQSNRLLHRYDPDYDNNKSFDACSQATEDTCCTAKLLDIALNSHWDGPGPSHPTQEEKEQLALERAAKKKASYKSDGSAGRYSSNTSSSSRFSSGSRRSVSFKKEDEDVTDTIDDQADNAMARIQALLNAQAKEKAQPQKQEKAQEKAQSQKQVQPELVPELCFDEHDLEVQKVQARSESPPDSPASVIAIQRPKTPLHVGGSESPDSVQNVLPQNVLPRQLSADVSTFGYENDGFNLPPMRPESRSQERPPRNEFQERLDRPETQAWVRPDKPDRTEEAWSENPMPQRPMPPEPAEPSMEDKKKAWEQRRARVKKGAPGKVKYGDVIRQCHEQFIEQEAEQPRLANTKSAPMPVPVEIEPEDLELQPVSFNATAPAIQRNKSYAGKPTEAPADDAAAKYEERKRRKQEAKKKGLSTYGATLRNSYEQIRQPGEEQAAPPQNVVGQSDVKEPLRLSQDGSTGSNEEGPQRCFTFGGGKLHTPPP